MNRVQRACAAQARESFQASELRVSRARCASLTLARDLRRDADLRAPEGVRMVWWGFRALKTPERA
jgi:hypothetical protein